MKKQKAPNFPPPASGRPAAFGKKGAKPAGKQAAKPAGKKGAKPFGKSGAK